MKTSAIMPAAQGRRLKLSVRGAVQGVGFRPFVHRLASELDLRGWVNNSPQGVGIEVEGKLDRLETFLHRLEKEKPPRCSIQSLEASWLAGVGFSRFEIRSSETGGEKTALLLPEIATCPDCLREIFDPENRRFRYPFTNCTHCGPRFSIIEALPYDRANTSMKKFTLCPACQAEYDNPRDRRFHAQPNACQLCGPHLVLWNATGAALSAGDDALLNAAAAIRCGRIVAVKGIGGFHLLADARNEKAVQSLRWRKHRQEKPFALMFPSLASAQAVCEISPPEERLLQSAEAPIVLLRQKRMPAAEGDGELDELGAASARNCDCMAPSVAPGNPNLGVMLPSNPLHHLLMAELRFPVIATSGNLSDEPICTEEHEAFERLRGIADLFLGHNRPLVRHVDDSIVRVMLGRELILRRARGYAPLPVQIKKSKFKIQTVLAVGAHLKNSVALAVGKNVFISQHIGDLETEKANHAFRQVVSDFETMFETRPEIIAADLHPDYLSTKYALERLSLTRRESANTQLAGSETGAPKIFQVQHHVAHVLSCIAENEVELPALGVAWDGTGYGTDGTIWGGEFFLVTGQNVERVAHLRPFRLPGGDKAVKEPRRAALGLLYELYGETAFEMSHLVPLREMPPVEMITLKGMLQRQFNSPMTSSVGRLFDVVASLLNLRQQMQFEGQPAMELEFALDGLVADKAYRVPIVARSPVLVLDWALMVHSILTDVNSGVPVAEISSKFHNALAETVVEIAKRFGQSRVALSGGCFQNRYLTERVVTRLRAENIQPFWHQHVPPNDGGVALGQVFAAQNDLNLK